VRLRHQLLGKCEDVKKVCAGVDRVYGSLHSLGKRHAIKRAFEWVSPHRLILGLGVWCTPHPGTLVHTGATGPTLVLATQGVTDAT